MTSSQQEYHQFIRSKGIQSMSRRRRRFCLILLAILVLLVLPFLYAAWPGAWTFTVSTETTYITGPLDKYGYVDYVTALNERLGQGIKPEENANVLLWQVFGPYPEGKHPMPAEYWRWLGIESPPEEGNYWVSWDKWVKANPALQVQVQEDSTNDPLDWARYWPWSADQEPELANYLRRNEKSLALVVDATKRLRYFNPIVPERTEEWASSMFEAKIPKVQQCRELASALACRAMLRLAREENAEAWQDLLACHRLGRLVAQGSTLIQFLVGLAIDRIAGNADVVYLHHARLTSRQALKCLDDLRQLPTMPLLNESVNFVERFVVLDIYMMIIRGGAPTLDGLSKGGSFSLTRSKGQSWKRRVNFDPALRNLIKAFDQMNFAIQLPNRTERLREINSLVREMSKRAEKAKTVGSILNYVTTPSGRGETMGDILNNLWMPAEIAKVQGAAERLEQGRSNLRLAFALAAHHADQGKYPDKLEELVPKYLSSVPNDLFSEKPLIYRLDGPGYLLYSVGPNGINEEGPGNDDAPRGDDLAIRMPPRDRRQAK
jgi:hypothetical protein